MLIRGERTSGGRVGVAGVSVRCFGGGDSERLGPATAAALPKEVGGLAAGERCLPWGCRTPLRARIGESDCDAAVENSPDER